MLAWCGRSALAGINIAPGNPMQNGSANSFNRAWAINCSKRRCSSALPVPVSSLRAGKWLQPGETKLAVEI